MQLHGLTTTNFKRHLSAIYAIKELIQSQKMDEYEFMTDTLMVSYYGLQDMLEELEAIQREEIAKRLAKMQRS